MGREAQVLLKPVVKMGNRPARALGQGRQFQGLGVVSIEHFQRLLQFDGQALFPLDPQVQLGLKMDAAEDVAQQYPRIERVVGVEMHDLMRKDLYLVEVFPAGEPWYPAGGILAVLESHRQATIRVVEVASPNGPVAGDVPEDGSGSDFLPFFIDFHPAAPAGHNFDALPRLAESNGIRMRSRALLKVGDGVDVDSVSRLGALGAGDDFASSFEIRFFDNTSYFLTIIGDCAG